jgi:hypothetical protein
MRGWRIGAAFATAAILLIWCFWRFAMQSNGSRFR